MGLKKTPFVCTVEQEPFAGAQQKGKLSRVNQNFGPPGTTVNLRLLEFIQDQPPERPASEVLELARSAGFELELMHVYKYRELGRNKARGASRETKETTMEEPQQESAPVQTKPQRGRPGRRQGGEDTRAGWVRSLSLDVPVKEVVERGREKGWELSEGYVYAIRSKLKASKSVSKKAVEASTRGKKTSESPSPRGRKKAQTTTASPATETLFRKPSEAEVEKVEEEFAKLALEIGLLRSGQLLEELQGRLTEFVRSKNRG